MTYLVGINAYVTEVHWIGLQTCLKDRVGRETGVADVPAESDIGLQVQRQTWRRGHEPQHRLFPVLKALVEELKRCGGLRFLISSLLGGRDVGTNSQSPEGQAPWPTRPGGAEDVWRHELEGGATGQLRRIELGPSLTGIPANPDVTVYVQGDSATHHQCQRAARHRCASDICTWPKRCLTARPLPGFAHRVRGPDISKQARWPLTAHNVDDSLHRWRCLPGLLLLSRLRHRGANSDSGSGACRPVPADVQLVPGEATVTGAPDVVGEATFSVAAKDPEHAPAALPPAGAEGRVVSAWRPSGGRQLPQL
mmetsp:Transcript_35079/g.79089  ORF Transcript_35079/g.79089 Transcript_35079/m.79089 type:complete len:309 (-) Transcript_35079:153-1079(-)